MSKKIIVRVKDVMTPDFDLVDGMDTVADVLKKSSHPESKCRKDVQENDKVHCCPSPSSL